MHRRAKQASIIFFYGLFLVLLITGLFYIFFYQAPTCTDGKQNQDETGIDCGGKCSQYCVADLASQPLSISSVETVAYGTTSSDAIGVITNKNSKAALKNALYTFRIYDQQGKVIGERSELFSLLPLESRTVTALGLGIPKNQIARTELIVESEEWIAFTDYTEPPTIRIANPQFSLLTGQAGYAEARGLVQNESPYDIRTLSIVVLVRDGSGKTLSVNKTTMNTLQSGEQRDFRLVWPQAFEGTPSDTEMEIHFNMLAEDAFVEQYFPGGEFQSLNPER